MHKTLELPENFSDAVLIGSGGMATVYRADDATMKRVVAVKVMTPALSAQQLKRFSSEAKAMSRLDHPNIVKIYSCGQLANTQPFMVLEYVDGESLDKIIAREGKLEERRAVELFKQLAAALACAHKQNIVHRDVKPSNVIVVKADRDNETAKLADFGIARDLMRITQATTPGTMIGSPAYASPEQCAGQPVDARSDVYSIGCLMYEALSGHAPFTGDDVLSVVMQHHSEQPSQLPNVSSGINRIVQRCLAKSPAERFADGAELLAALKHGDTSYDPSTVGGGTPRGRSRGNTMRNAAVVVGMLLAIVCIAVGVAGQLTPKPKVVTESPVGLRYDRAFGLVHGGLQPHTHQQLVEATSIFESIRHEADQAGGQLAYDVHYELGYSYLELHVYAEALNEFREAVRRRAGTNTPDDWHAENALATAYMYQNNYTKAQQIWEQMVRFHRGDDGLKSFGPFQLARITEKQAFPDYRQALKYYQAAIDNYTPNTWAEGERIPPQARAAIAEILKKHPELRTTTASPSK